MVTRSVTRTQRKGERLMSPTAETDDLISRRAGYFVRTYGAGSEAMAVSIQEAMQLCGSAADNRLWTRIVAAVQRHAPKDGETATRP